MEEEVKKEDTKPQHTLSILEQAEIIAKRIEDANRRSEELLQKNEQAISRVMLSGRANGGVPEIKPKEESAKEYAERVISGKLNKQ